jgi:serine/threonine-protein kinase
MGGTWAANDRIYFARVPPAGLGAVPASGGPTVSLTTLGEGEILHAWPQVLPGNRHVLFGVRRGERLDDVDVEVVTIATLERRTVLKSAGSRAVFIETGHLVYSQGSTLLAIEFDLASLQTRGSPTRVLEGVAVAPLTAFTDPVALFDVSTSGTLVHMAGGVLSDPTEMIWYASGSGRTEGISAPPGAYVDPSLSADGRKVALAPSYGTREQNIWVHDFDRQTWTRVTGELPIESFAPVWHPLDPDRLIFTAIRRGSQDGAQDLMTIRADGSSPPELLYASARPKYASSSSAEAALVAFTELADHSFDIWLLDLRGTRPSARPFLQTRFNETSPSLSPDGRWVTYDSNETGSTQVYVRPISGNGKWQISTDGGARPRWTRDGRTIVYRRLRLSHEPPGPDRMVAVSVTTVPSFRPGLSQVIAKGTFSPGGTSTPNYDVSADGRRLLLITRPAELPRLPVVVVENWLSELRSKVPR